MTDRSLPAAARRGLTFWRRSIQARVVASTLLLSAAVVGVVGWFLLQQTRDGLLEQRVDAVVAEANNETTEARTRLAAAPGTDIDRSAQQRDLVDPIIQRGDTRGFSVVLAGPVGSDGLIADGVAFRSADLDTSSVPVSLQQHFSEPGRHRLDVHRDPHRERGRKPTHHRARHRRGLAGRAARPTARRTPFTTCSRSPPSRRPWRSWPRRS